MAESSKVLNIFPMSGGMTRSVPSVLIPTGHFYDLNNVVFNVGDLSTPRKRPGLKQYKEDITPVPLDQFILDVDILGELMDETTNMSGLFDFWRNVNNSQVQKIVCFINGKIFADNISKKGVFGLISGTTTFDVNDSISFDVYGGLLVMTFDNATPKMWNMTGNVQDLSAEAPNGSIYRTFNGCGWITGVKSNPHVVYKSADGDIQEWTNTVLGADSFDLDLGDGDPVGNTAIFPPLFNDLYVAKRKSIYRLRPNGDGTYANQSIVKGIGCISHNTVVAVNNDIIFASERGVHSLSVTDKYGSVETAFLSKNINDYYINNVDFNFRKKMKAVFSQSLNSYLLSYVPKGSTYNKNILGYDLGLGRWFEWRDINALAMCNYLDSYGVNNVMIGRRDGKIGYLDENTRFDFDDTSMNISMVTGHIFPSGNLNQQHGFKKIIMFYKPKNNSLFNVTYKIDQDTAKVLQFDNNPGSGSLWDYDFTWDLSLWDAEGEYKRVVKDINGYGNVIKLSISHNDDIEIFGCAIEFTDASDTNKDVMS